MSDGAGELVVDLEARDSATSVVRGLEEQLVRTERSSTRTGRAIGDGLNRGSTTARSGFVALQQQMARNEAISGNYAAAIQRLERLQSSFTVSNQQTLQVENQLIQTRNKAIAEIERQAEAQRKLSDSNNNLKNGFAGLQSVLGGLGLAFSAQQIVQFGLSAITAANTLEKTKATALALSGTQSKYNQLLTLATEGQRRYGGSLDGNIKGLSGLVNLSNRAGISLADLDNISRRLATVDPVQGMEGAAYALKEFFSSNNASAAKSLIDRFELSPKLKEIAASGADAQTKMAALDAELNKLGITNAVLTNQTETTANAFDQLGAAAENFKTNLGTGLQQALAPAARGGTELLNLSTNIQRAGENALAASKDYDAYRAANERLRTDLAITGAQIPLFGQLIAGSANQVVTLSQKQYEYARSLTATGVGTQEAIAKAQQLSTVLAQVSQVETINAQSHQLSAQAMSQLGDQITRIAGLSAQDQANVQGLITAYLQHKLTIDQLRDALTAIETNYAAVSAASGQNAVVTAENTAEIQKKIAAEQQHQALQSSGYGMTMQAVAAEQQVQQAIAEHNKELDEAAAKQQIAAVASQELEVRTKSMDAAARAAAANIIASGVNIQAAAARVASSSVLVDQLTAAYLRLAAAQQVATRERAKEVFGGSTGRQVNEDIIAETKGGYRTQQQAQQEKNRKLTEENRQAELDYQASIGNRKPLISDLERQQDRLVKGTKSWYEIQKKIDQLNAQNAADAKRGGKGGKGGGGGGVDPRVREEVQTQGKLTEAQITAQNKQEDALQEHLDKEAEIVDEANRKRVEAQRELEDDLLSSQASFYDTLINMDNQKIAREYDAKYQEALANLPKIAAEKGADVADAYLKSYENGLKNQAKRAEEIAKAEKDGNKSRAEALRGVDALKRAEEERANQRALEGRGSINTTEQEQIAQEGEAYQKKLDDIANDAERSGEKIERQSQRRIDLLDKEGKKVDSTAQSYSDLNRIAGGGSAGTGSGGSNSATNTATAEQAAQNPTPTADANTQLAGDGVDRILQALAQVANAVRDLAPGQEGISKAVEKAGKGIEGAVKSLDNNRRPS